MCFPLPCFGMKAWTILVIKNTVTMVHGSDKNPIAFISEFLFVWLLQGTIVPKHYVKCVFRYRVFRYQIDETLDLV